jgi:hypothetical protein
MFDMDSKYADVVSLDSLIGALNGTAPELVDAAG